jgi:hypothetical protein
MRASLGMTVFSKGMKKKNGAAKPLHFFSSLYSSIYCRHSEGAQRLRNLFAVTFPPYRPDYRLPAVCSTRNWRVQNP